MKGWIGGAWPTGRPGAPGATLARRSFGVIVRRPGAGGIAPAGWQVFAVEPCAGGIATVWPVSLSHRHGAKYSQVQMCGGAGLSCWSYRLRPRTLTPNPGADVIAPGLLYGGAGLSSWSYRLRPRTLTPTPGAEVIAPGAVVRGGRRGAAALLGLWLQAGGCAPSQEVCGARATLGGGTPRRWAGIVNAACSSMQVACVVRFVTRIVVSGRR